jgi:hypothetical protein
MTYKQAAGWVVIIALGVFFGHAAFLYTSLLIPWIP